MTWRDRSNVSASNMKRSRSSVVRCPRWYPASAAPPVRKTPCSRAKNASSTSRWNGESLEQAIHLPAVDEKAPESPTSSESAFDPRKCLGDVCRTNELPDVDVACLSEHFAEGSI